jgi:hypothetical protein
MKMLTTLFQTGMDTFLNIFGDSAAWMLIFAGCMALVWFFYEGYRNGGFIHRTKEDFEKYDDISKVLKIIILLGMILGAIEIATGIITIMLNLSPSNKFAEVVGEQRYDLLTSALLIIMGIVMFLKPMLDAPLSAIIGLIASILVGIALAIFIPKEWVDLAYKYSNIDPRYILIGVAGIVGLMVGLMAKFTIGSLETIAKVLSWPPIALLMAIVCLVQGFGVLIFGYTLTNLF